MNIPKSNPQKWRYPKKGSQIVYYSWKKSRWGSLFPPKTNKCQQCLSPSWGKRTMKGGSSQPSYRNWWPTSKWWTSNEIPKGSSTFLIEAMARKKCFEGIVSICSIPKGLIQMLYEIMLYQRYPILKKISWRGQKVKQLTGKELLEVQQSVEQLSCYWCLIYRKNKIQLV